MAGVGPQATRRLRAVDCIHALNHAQEPGNIFGGKIEGIYRSTVQNGREATTTTKSTPASWWSARNADGKSLAGIELADGHYRIRLPLRDLEALGGCQGKYPADECQVDSVSALFG